MRDFYRNSGISFAAIFVLTITIALVTGLFFLHGITDSLVTSLQNKIDITAYFKSDVPEEEILNVKDQISKLQDVKNITYVSKKDALASFKEKHQDNPVLADALIQVGNNPFLPSLNITTTGDPLGYAKIAGILEDNQLSDLVDKVDYSDKKATIEKVFSVTSNVNKFLFGLTVILVLLAAAIVFNTIQLAINNSKEEIKTMKIVGASSWFVRSPFVIQGAMIGFVAFVVCFFATIFSVNFLTPGLSVLMPGFSLWGYFISNFWFIILLQMGFGVTLGVVSSLIVLNKYLKI